MTAAKRFAEISPSRPSVLSTACTFASISRSRSFAAPRLPLVSGGVASAFARRCRRRAAAGGARRADPSARMV